MCIIVLNITKELRTKEHHIAIKITLKESQIAKIKKEFLYIHYPYSICTFTTGAL